jgi:hypothetical protein
MPLKQPFTYSDINALLNTACVGKFELKDQYIVMQLSQLTLSMTEHNLLKIHDLINEKGEIYSCFAIDPNYTRNNKERPINIPERLALLLNDYLEWYSRQSIPSEYRHNLNTYRGFSKKAPVLLNDYLKEFTMGENKLRKGTGLQPTSLRAKVSKLLKLAALDWATPKTFENSLVINLAHKNVSVSAIRKAFGYSSNDVVTDKINGNILTLSDALNKVYSGIKVTGH